MKGFVIFIVLLITANSSFLRQLTDVAVTEVTFTTNCVLKTDTPNESISMSLKVEEANANTGTTYTAVISAGESTDINSIPCTKGTDNKSFTCTKALAAENIVGVYKLKSLTETGGSPVTYKVGDTATGTFTFAETVELATPQTTPQDVDAKDDSKKTFKIVLAAVASYPPAIFANAEATTPLSACTLGTDKKTVTCTPTEDEMEDGKEYAIQYNKGCTKTATGVTVNFEGSSAFVTLSKVALIAFALLF